MGQSDKAPTGPFNAVIRIATEMLIEHKQKRNEQTQFAVPAPEPVDCGALLALIQAAQAVYTENCPIATPTEPAE